MSNSWFKFKQFFIDQDRCAMKISTDAVLLGALAQAENMSHILDIGTGTGVIALMLAQRFQEASIHAVEIDPAAAEQAGENFANSPFASRLSVSEGRLQDFSRKEKYDLIVSNPPYFPAHLKSSNPLRNKALHTDDLSFNELIEKTVKLLTDEGRLWVILPPRQMQDFEKIAGNTGIFPVRKYTVQDAPEKRVIREIADFSFKRGELTHEAILIKDGKGGFHHTYTELVSGFLLNH